MSFFSPLLHEKNIESKQRFYVAEIKENMSPLSPFPSTQYSTFEEYYSKKYTMKVTDKEQPLIDVDHSSVRFDSWFFINFNFFLTKLF